MKKFSVVLLISTMTAVIACNKGYGGGGLGWGEPLPVIVLPKPTLLPKLKQAFIDGKLSVDYHKIVAPSLKPLPYKKGIGWIGKDWGHGWGHSFNAIGPGFGHGWGHFDHHPFSVGKTGYLGVSYGKGYGYGKGVGVGKGLGIEYGKGAYGFGGVKGPIGGGHIPPIGHHIPVTPIAPVAHKLPIPHGPIGPVGHIGPVAHIGHTVSHNAVTVVEKGLPHLPHGPIGNDLYRK